VTLAAHVGPEAEAEARARTVKVLLCDDSAVIRGAIARILEADPAVRVAASVSNGRMAVDAVARHEVDVVILDIEMPVMDGITALPLILAARPGVKVLMASTLTRRNAAISLKALALGAADYLAKPEAGSMHNAEEFRHELLRKVQGLAGVRRRRGAPAPVAPLRVAPRPAAALPPQVLAIGSSTGGPQALLAVLGALGTIAAPILITQHMPPTFTAVLAESLERATGIPAAEGVEGEPARPGRIYVAPGDVHMTVEGSAAEPRIRIARSAPENYCRPAVDPMLRGVAATFGPRALAVILTGMGSDGCKGAEAVVAAGGTVFAQDEASSVVWGMPGAVARAGLCSAVLPLARLGPEIRGQFIARAP
jgi:two-component system chemotaxis response regulator CheB